MPQLIGKDRHQLEFFCLDAAVASDSEVRIIDAFVEVLDLEDLGFEIKGESREGRPAFCSQLKEKSLKIQCQFVEALIKYSRK